MTVSNFLNPCHPIGPYYLSQEQNSPVPMTEQNRQFFMQVVHAQLSGWAMLPHGLGLELRVYRELLHTMHDERLIQLDTERSQLKTSDFNQRSQLISQLTSMRLAERNELVDLLFTHAQMNAPYATQVAIVIATACLSPSHLWKTLGLLSRDDLRTILQHNFPALVARNTKNMRWKRFFYLQLCQSEGDYICKAPSCESCTSHRECYDDTN